MNHELTIFSDLPAREYPSISTITTFRWQKARMGWSHFVAEYRLGSIQGIDCLLFARAAIGPCR